MIITHSVIYLYHFDVDLYAHHNFLTQVIYEALLYLSMHIELMSAQG